MDKDSLAEPMITSNDDRDEEEFGFLDTDLDEDANDTKHATYRKSLDVLNETFT